MVRSLIVSDVEQIVHLTGRLADPSLDLSIPDRKRLLAEGIKQLIDADVYIWSSAVMSTEKIGEVGSTCTIDGGWTNEVQKRIAFEVLTDPEFGARAIAPMLQFESGVRSKTLRREDYMDDATWEIVGRKWRQSGLEHALLTSHALPPPAYSAVGFHRVASKPRFSERDKAIVSIVMSQINWLHHHGMNHAAGDSALYLSPRERQTLVHLLQGRSKKEIASILEISEHTVGDYVKAIYKRYEVMSHAELQATFLIGSDSAERFLKPPNLPKPS